MNEINNPAAKEFIRQVEEIVGKTDELTAICPYIKSYGSTKQLQALTEKIGTLPESELIAAHDTIKDMPGWHQLPDTIDNVIDKVKQAAQQRPSELSKVASTQANCSLGTCPSGPSQAQVDDLLIAVAAADLATALAQATADTIGIGKPLTELAANIAQAIASGLDVVGKTLALAASIQQRAADVVAECEDQAVKNLLISMCNTINIIDSKVDKIIEKLEIMDQKLDAILKLLREIKDVVDEILLHQIEEALAECKMLVGLYLPESAFGSINKVQNIVEKLINNSKAAGLTVANAQSYWKQGSAALSKGQYERALQWFMLSYKQLQDKDMCKVPCPSDPCDRNTSCCKCED